MTMPSQRIKLLLTSHLVPPKSLDGSASQHYEALAHLPEAIDFATLRRSTTLPLDLQSPSNSPEIREHLAEAWGIKQDDVQHTCLKTHGSPHWFWIKDNADWESWVATLLATTRDVQQASEYIGPIEAAVVLRGLSTPAEEGSSQVTATQESLPSPRETPPPRSLNSTADLAPDPKEGVPFSHPSVPSSSTSNRMEEIEQIFNVGTSIANGVIGTLSSLARSISAEVEAMRGQHGSRLFSSSSQQSRTLFAGREEEELAQGSKDASESLHQGLDRVLATMRQVTGQDPPPAPQAVEPQLAQETPAQTTESDELYAQLAREYEVVLLDSDHRSESEESEMEAESAQQGQQSTRSRKRRSRNGGLLSTLGMLATMMLFFFPVLIGATPLGTDLSRVRTPHIRSLVPLEVEVERRSTSVQHVCKCTCFSTNSTLVPLYAPVDPTKPCTTCTRQFCIAQNLAICKDAKLGKADGDTSTGWEGDVWAKCFERDSYKDQSIITLYLLVVVGLVAFAALRGRMGGWYEEYRSIGPRGIYDAVASAPWRR